eukprot:329107-Chlamydomonas_euryale.AAC.3
MFVARIAKLQLIVCCCHCCTPAVLTSELMLAPYRLVCAGTISPCLTQENTKAESFVSGRAIGRTLLQYQPAVPLDPIRFQTGHSDTVFDVACSPTDPSVLASGSSDYTVQLWNVKTLERLGIMSGHAAPVSSVAFNPNGTLIASADTIGIVKVSFPVLLCYMHGYLNDTAGLVWCNQADVQG